jgi:Protein of unknown function (DUF2971)
MVIAMPILPEEYEQYQAFVKEQAEKLKVFDFDKEQILWHYTTGTGLLGIIESGTLFSTQVSCLNDSTEVRYGSNLLRSAYLELFRERSIESPQAKELLQRYETTTVEDPSAPIHAPSYWFVTCFSRNGDDLSQWRAYSGGENGYAIGFQASHLFGPTGLLARVNYDAAEHKAVAEEVAKATFRFYQEGIERRGDDAAAQWALEFFPEFSKKVDQLSPMVKHPAFISEEEYRIIHQLQIGELGRIRFRQKATLLARHFPLTFAGCPFLPITQIRVGPSRHKEITRISVDTLLRQKGYPTGLVTTSDVPFQLT